MKEAKDLNVPFNVLIGESVEVAKFTKKYWEPTDKRPGLSSAGSKLPETTALEWHLDDSVEVTSAYERRRRAESRRAKQTSV